METLPSYAEDIYGGDSPSISMLSEVAAARKITIVGGSIPEKASGKVFNTCCVIGPDGQILAKHRKVSTVAGEAVVWIQILMCNFQLVIGSTCIVIAKKMGNFSCTCLRLTSQETSSSRNLIHSQAGKKLL